jgi:transcriptional regulator with PAS, ATPase and Fis domain
MARRGARVASTIIRRGERVAGGEVTAPAYRTGSGRKKQPIIIHPRLNTAAIQ